MKVKVTSNLLSYDGKEIVDQDQAKITVRVAIFQCLNSFKNDEDVSPETKLQCFRVSNKVFSKKEVDFTVKELSLIRERAEKMLPPVILGRLLEIIDPSSIAEDK